MCVKLPFCTDFTAKTFLYHSRGKQDFEKLLNQLVVKPDSIGKEWGDEMNFLLNIGIIRQ